MVFNLHKFKAAVISKNGANDTPTKFSMKNNNVVAEQLVNRLEKRLITG